MSDEVATVVDIPNELTDGDTWVQIRGSRMMVRERDLNTLPPSAVGVLERKAQSVYEDWQGDVRVMRASIAGKVFDVAPSFFSLSVHSPRGVLH